MTTTCFSDGDAYWHGTKQTLAAMIEKKNVEGIDEFNFED
jgi:hypothetical protein